MTDRMNGNGATGITRNHQTVPVKPLEMHMEAFNLNALDIAARLGVSESTVQKWIRAGEMTASAGAWLMEVQKRIVAEDALKNGSGKLAIILKGDKRDVDAIKNMAQHLQVETLDLDF